MNRYVASLILLLSLFATFNSFADVTKTYAFDDEVVKLRFQTLTKELRCPKCQNQNLADSNSMQAGDLRREIYNMLNANKSDQEIVDFMVYRYGDFVLYRPQLKASTWLLWFGPFIFLIVSVVFIIRFIKGRSVISDEMLSEDEAEKLKALLDNQASDRT